VAPNIGSVYASRPFATPENCLPACTRCNRLRLHLTGDGIRELLLLGVIAVKAIKDGTQAGKQLEQRPDGTRLPCVRVKTVS
jgi:hypothetical protein